MPKACLKLAIVPEPLRGWILLNRDGIPRYWSTVWSCIEGANLHGSTHSNRLRSIEKFYLFVTEINDEDCLDRLISSTDIDALEHCLTGYFVRQKNRGDKVSNSTSNDWRTVFKFISCCVLRIHQSNASNKSLDGINSKLLNLERLYNSLKPNKSRQAVVAKALPLEVVHDVYEIVNPESDRNPFRTESLRWRNFALVLLMLHQGLRRSETLVLALDAVKQASIPGSDGIRRWLNVENNPYELEDKRFDCPSLKNVYANRQIPIGDDVWSVVDMYVTNFRGKPSHSYLFNSQKNNALSARSVNEVFESISLQLNPTAREILKSMRSTESVFPHSLRHTCAVVRLEQLARTGMDMDLALQKLRVLFGWSRDSEMPHHYARAYFEGAFASSWEDSFDRYVDALKNVPRSVLNEV